jgi:DNA-binding NarL/FixJ family response regulator
MNRIRTLIADDHGAMRRVLRAMLEGYHHLEIIGEASNGEEAIQHVNSLHPDLIIMDISMPGLDGLTAAEVIKRSNPETKIVIFSMHNVRELIDSAQKLGLDGFVLKDEGRAGLLLAIHEVLQRRTHFPDRK